MGNVAPNKEMRTKGVGHVALMGECKNIMQNLHRICSRNLRTFFLFWPLKNRGA